MALALAALLFVSCTALTFVVFSKSNQRKSECITLIGDGRMAPKGKVYKACP